MSWDAAFAGEREQAARGPQPANPATLGEVWRAGWNAAGLDTVFGQGDPWAQAQGELRSAVEGAAGLSAAEIARAQGRTLKSLDWSGSSWQDQARELAEMSSGLTPEQQEKVKPHLDVAGRARKLAADREREAADVADRTYGLAGHAVGFLAGVTRAAVDPINIATMAVGGPLRGPVLRMLAREAGLGMAVQAAQEPLIEAGRAELGLDAGLGRALGNVVEAGIGNAGLAGLFRGAGWLMRRAALPTDAPVARAGEAASAPSLTARLDGEAPGAVVTPAPREAGTAVADAAPALRELPPVLRELPPALRELGPDDLDTAARLAERDELIDALAPDQSGVGKLVHGETVETVLARMESAGGDVLAGLDMKIADIETRLREPSGQELAPAQTAGGEGVPSSALPARRQRPKAEPRPVSLGRFIAMNGGLKIDAQGDVRYLGINQMFVPGHGMVGRINGRLLDRDLEPMLIAEGYLRPHDPDMPSRDVTAEIYDALDQEFRGKRPLYRQRDQARAQTDAELGRQRDIDQRWQDEIDAEVQNVRTLIDQTEGRIRQDDFEPGEIEAIADRMMRGLDDDWESAFEHVVMARELRDDASPTALAAAQDSNDWEIADAIFGRDAQQDRGRAGSGGGEGGEPPAAGRSATPREAVAGAGGSRGTEGGREGDAALDPTRALAALSSVSDEPTLFKARLADLQRSLDAAGGDIRLELDSGTVSVRDLLREIADDATAADALKACLGQGAAS